MSERATRLCGMGNSRDGFCVLEKGHGKRGAACVPMGIAPHKAQALANLWHSVGLHAAETPDAG